MTLLFSVKDLHGRVIYLSTERWKHISKRHPHIVPYLYEIPSILQHPLSWKKVSSHKVHYSAYFKAHPFPEKFLVVVGKYLNNHGFIVTAHFTKHL